MNLSDRFILKSAFLSIILFWGALPLLAGQEKAAPQELAQYVKAARASGLEVAQIQKNAIKAGWSEQEVQTALGPLHSKSKADDPVAASPSTVSPVIATASQPQAPASPAKAASQQPVAQPVVAPQQSTTANAETGKPGTVSRGVPDEYRIGEGDILQVNVWGEPTASVASVVVRPDGKITIPLVKDISVSGMTPAEAEKMITEQLSKQIKAADVTVIVNAINSKKIFVVGGGVKNEGPISYTYRMTVMQALSEAGGLTDYAKRKKIYVLRNENGRQYQLKFDYDAVLKGEHMETNIPMIPGDTLVVPNH